jgi:hypothetical protein
MDAINLESLYKTLNLIILTNYLANENRTNPMVWHLYHLAGLVAMLLILIKDVYASMTFLTLHHKEIWT